MSHRLSQDSVDVAIVGGGVVGVACANELAQRGVKVSVLERGAIGQACSYGNAGWLTPSLALPLAQPGMLFKSLRWMFDPESPLYIQPRLDPAYVSWLARFAYASQFGAFERGAEALVTICRASVDMWEALSKRSAEGFGFERHGLLVVYEHDASREAAKKQFDLVERYGIKHELWSADEIRQREPAIIGRQVGGYFFPDDAHCEPYRAVRALAAEAVRAGATLEENAEVFAIDDGTGGRRTLKTTRGDISAERIVLAAGSWSESVGRMLDLHVPILGAKGYSVVLPRAAQHPTRSIYLTERKVAVNPHHDALRLAGTLELVRNDFSINERRVDVILRGAREMMVLADQSAAKEVWRGLRPCAPDGMPLIGRARGRGDVWLATGHQMTGLKTAPGTGLLLAQLMTGQSPQFDPEPFRADRY